MKLIYNNKDITNDIKVISASITDNCGGKADCIDLVLSDQKKWIKWEPKKDDSIVLLDNGFSSGLMYIDGININNVEFMLNAISTPLKAKSNRSKVWENIRFKELAKQLVEEVGLQLETYSIENHLYDRLDMIDKTNLEYLNERCILEGYSLKITDGKAVIYDEKALEKYHSVKDITEDMIIGKYKFFNTSNGLYSAVELDYFSNENKSIKYRFAPENAPIGPIFRTNIKANNYGEAERFSRAILRNFNKNEITGSFSIRKDTTLAAGNVINIKSFGMFKGKYFISSIKHMLNADKSYLKVRKVLEGY